MNKFVHTVVIVAATGLTASPVLSQSAGSEWENLNRDVESLYRKRQYDRAIVVARKALEVAEENAGANQINVATSLNNLAALYKRQAQYAQAEPLYKRSLAIHEKALGPDHPNVAASLNSLALIYKTQGRYAQAEPLYKRSLAIREKALGRDHPIVAISLNNLASLYKAQGQYAQAEPLYKRSLTIKEKILGPDFPTVATSLNNLAGLYKSQGQYAQAEPLYKRSLAIYEKAFGPDHPDVATSLNNLAGLYHTQGQYSQAEPLYKRSLAISEKALGPDHPDVGASLNNLAALYKTRSQYARAEPLYKRSLAIREKALGPDHPDVAESLNNLASLYEAQGQYAQAEPIYKRSLAIHEKALGPHHPNVAASLNSLALIYKTQGRYAQAEPLYKRSLAIYEKVFGPDHPHLAMSLNNLASLYKAQGQYAQAEPLYKRSLGIKEKVLGPNIPTVATSLNNLAGLYESQGQYAQAEPLYKRSLAIYEKAFGPDHPDVAMGLSNLAGLYHTQGQYSQAVPLYKRSLAIREKVLGPDHPDVGASLNNLAVLYKTRSQYARAEPLYKRSLAIREKALGPDHPDVAESLNNLAELYREQGQFAETEPLHRRSLAIHEKTLGPEHPDVATSLGNLSLLYDVQGEYAQAEPLCKRALAITRRSLELTAVVQSEQRQLAMAENLRHYLDSYLSLTVRAGPPAAEAYAEALAWKGSVTARQGLNRLARSTRDPEIARTLSELQSTSTRLATLTFAVPDPNNRQSWQRQLQDLNERRQDLEAELSRKSAEFRQQQSARKRTAADLQAALPADAALVDLLEYWHSEPPSGGKGKLQFERRWIAFVVRPGRPIVAVHVPSAKDVNDAISHWRMELTGRQRTVGVEPGQELRRLVWDKLVPHLEGATTVLISPDGAAAFLPWGALPGTKPGTYLIEECTIGIVPVPQLLPELMKNRGTVAANQALLLVGGVNYDGSAPAAPAAGDVAAVSRSAPRGEGLAWTPLPGTSAEIATIKDSFTQRHQVAGLTELRGDLATEEQVRSGAIRCRYLHFATHGFFAPPQMLSALAHVRPQDERELFSQRQQVIGYNPGLLSGLVLAGANRPPEPGRDDGILTALEVGELDLSGVELATLSACETGLGKSAGGEGVLGLQRAFQVAGCRNGVGSLGKVDGGATAALMKVFYHKLWEENKPPIVALREAQLAILRHPEQIGDLATTRGPNFEKTVKLVDQGRVSPTAKTAPPRLWAAFVISGAPQIQVSGVRDQKVEGEPRK